MGFPRGVSIFVNPRVLLLDAEYDWEVVSEGLTVF